MTVTAPVAPTIAPAPVTPPTTLMQKVTAFLKAHWRLLAEVAAVLFVGAYLGHKL